MEVQSLPPVIEIYTKNGCYYCDRAIELIESKSWAYIEINLSEHPEKIPEMLLRSSQRKTVPQIFINGQHVGGCDDLYQWDADGRLNTLMNSTK